jgi:nicotinate-nucleotide--dimethylbenzimidazole phosphoribosyltransferase
LDFVVPTPLSDDLRARVQAAIDTKTMPSGALGRVEAVAVQLAMLQRNLTPQMRHCTLTIFAADHGITDAGISAFPQAVTRQMVSNYLAGGAAASVFAAMLDVTVQIVDAGIAGPEIDDSNLIVRRMGAGTVSFLHQPAMSFEVSSAAQGCRNARRRVGVW